MTTNPIDALHGDAFLVILGDAPSMEDQLAQLSPDLLSDWTPESVPPPAQTEWTGGGLLWRYRPSKEVARLAGEARLVCGAKRPWANIEELAAFAVEEAALLAEAHATDFNIASARPDSPAPGLRTTAADVIELHGAADVLASSLLWSMQSGATGGLAEGRQTDHKSAVTGSVAVGAFALLMIDHAAYAMHVGHPVAAVELLSIGAQAFAYASMDDAHSMAARQAYKARKDAAKSGASEAAKARHRRLDPVRREIIDLYRSGAFKSANQAAHELVEHAMELARQCGAPLAPSNAQQTVYRWLLKADKGADSLPHGGAI